MFAEGPSKSPDKLSKDAVYNAIGSINKTVCLKITELGVFCRIECTDIARTLIVDVLARFDTDKIKLLDDHACLLAYYTALVISLELPENLKRFCKYKQEAYGLARWVTAGTGYLRIYMHHGKFNLSS